MVLLNILVNVLEDRLYVCLVDSQITPNWTGCTALGERIRIQNGLEELGRGSEINCMKFNKDKCKVLQSSRNKYKMGGNCVNCTTAEKDLRVIVNCALNMT